MSANSEPPPLTRSLHHVVTSLGRAAVVLALGLGLTSCGDGGTPTDTPDPATVAVVTVSPQALILDVGETGQLNATVRSSEGEVMDTGVVWSSTSTGVASVGSSGLVTGLSAGTTTIQASAGGVTGTRSVEVVDARPPAAPTGVTAVAISDSEVEVSWTDVSSNETGFRIERESLAAGAPPSGVGYAPRVEVGNVGANVTTFHDAGLHADTSYRYFVLACNESGCSEPGEPSEAGDDGTVVTTQPTLAIAQIEPPAGIVGTPYSHSLEATGGVGIHIWSLSEGALPAGLNLSGSGEIAGTPESPGTASFTVRVESGTQTATETLSIDVSGAGLTILTTALPDAIVAETYSAELQAGGGTGELSWSQVAGTMPPGLELSSAGALSGTPSIAGQWGFTVRVEDDLTAVSRSLTITVQRAAVATVEVAPSTASLAVGEQLILTATLKDAAGNELDDREVQWSTSNASVVNGVVLAGGYQSRNSAIAPGTAVVTARSEGVSGSATLTVTEGLPELTVTTSNPLPIGTVGQSYGTTLSAAGGTGSYEWSTVGGTVPPGLTLNENGVISGMPTTAGIGTFTVRVESGSQVATKQLSIGIQNAAVASVTVTPSVVTLSVGETVVLTATLEDAAGNELHDRNVEWLTSNQAVVDGSVLPGGYQAEATAIAPGTAVVTARSGGVTGTASVAVQGADPPPLTCGSIAGGSIYAYDGQFLGTLTNQFDSESILNEFGSYGSEFSSTSIYNPFGPYGSEFQSLSAYNPFAVNPPAIFIGGEFVAYVSKNTLRTPRIDPDALRTCSFP